MKKEDLHLNPVSEDGAIIPGNHNKLMQSKSGIDLIFTATY